MFNFADDWIWTADLWSRKQSFCQLSRNYSPFWEVRPYIFNINCVHAILVTASLTQISAQLFPQWQNYSIKAETFISKCLSYFVFMVDLPTYLSHKKPFEPKFKIRWSQFNFCRQWKKKKHLKFVNLFLFYVCVLLYLFYLCLDFP